MIKISILGVGHLGAIHTKLWTQRSNVHVAGIFDVDQQRALKVAEEFGTLAFGTLEEAINASDAVTIAVPTSEHFLVAMKCIDAGKHCLIEKPITATYPEATSLIDAAHKRGVLLQVGHVERFNPAFVAALQYKIKPLFIESHRLSQFRPRATDVSVIHDLMIHDIDIALWLVGSPAIKVDASGVGVLTDTTDIANARVEFANGCVANFTSSRLSANAMRKMRVFQRDAYFSIDFAKPSLDVYTIRNEGDINTGGVPAVMLGQIDAGTHQRNIVYETPKITSLNAIEEEHRTFVESIMDGKPISVRAEDAAEALRIASVIADQISSSVQRM